MPDYDIHKVFAQRLRAFERGMPAAEYDGQAGMKAFHHPADFDGIEDHGSGEQRNAKASGILNFMGDGRAPVAIKRAVDDARLIPGLPQGTGQAQKPERRAKGRPRVGRQEKYDSAGAAHGYRREICALISSDLRLPWMAPRNRRPEHFPIEE